MTGTTRTRGTGTSAACALLALGLGLGLAAGCATPAGRSMSVAPTARGGADAWSLAAPGGAALAGEAAVPDGAALRASGPGAWSTVTAAPAHGQDAWSTRAPAYRNRHVTLMGGAYELDSEWEPLDDQAALGIEIDESDRDTGEGWEAGLLYAGEDESFVDTLFGLGLVRADADTLQVYSGWRQTFRPQEHGFHPYLAAGFAVLWTRLDVSTASGSLDDDDIVPGAYLRAGVLWDLGADARLGVDYRHLFADDYEFLGIDAESDADQLLLTLGWAF